MNECNNRSILIDALSFDAEEGGFATVYLDLVASASQIPNISIFVVCHKNNRHYFEKYNCKVIDIWFPYKLRYFISQIITPFLVRYLKVQHVHFETTAVPFFLGTSVSITIHDLFFLKENYSNVKSVGSRILDLYWKYFYTKRSERANKIRVISKFTQSDVENLLNRNDGIELVYPVIKPPSKKFLPLAFPAEGEPLQLLFVGSIIPRKNLEFLFIALEHTKRAVVLQVAGNIWDENIKIRWENKPNIHFHGFVDDKKLEKLYSESHFLVSPSLEEGFGLPVVEAMIRGKGVLTSDIPVYREFVSDDARFSLNSPQTLADLIDSVTEEFYLRSLNFNLEISKKFSQDKFISGLNRLFTIQASKKDKHQ